MSYQVILNMHMHCFYVCMSCMYVCMHACTHGRTDGRMYVCVDVCIYVCLYVCMYVCVCVVVRSNLPISGSSWFSQQEAEFTVMLSISLVTHVPHQCRDSLNSPLAGLSHRKDSLVAHSYQFRLPFGPPGGLWHQRPHLHPRGCHGRFLDFQV